MSAKGRFEEDDFRDKIATVDEKGRRIWIYPKKQFGKFYTKRSIVAYILLVLLLAGPFIKIQGEPILMMNVIERKFVILGQVFWPADIFLFAIGLISFVILIIVFTVVFGRLFCGWVCPQTIFMEWIFRRIEYVIDGDWKQQKRLNDMPWNRHKIGKRLLKWSIFWVVSFIIGNTFLAYIIGIDELQATITDPPSEHLGSLVAMIIFTTVFFSVYTWFREQVCTVVCPYGRLQGVLLDKNSIVVAYDYIRGEIRSKFRKNEDREEAGKGDCIDCHQCVNVCPTGIDIRNGTQLECINCTLCMDACDYMMENVGLEKGLIRYDSENSISTGDKWKLTARAKSYIVLMIAIIGFLTTLVLTRSEIDAEFLRAKGSTYTQIDDVTYTNIFMGSFMNKTNEDKTVDLKVTSGNATVELVGGELFLPKGEKSKQELLVKMEIDEITGPNTPFTIGIFSGGKLIEEETVDFFGPGF